MDVNAASVGTVTGTVTELQAAYVSGVLGLGNEAITVTDASISVANANIVAGLTTGVVTATITEGDMATLAGLTETGHAYTVNVTDTANVSASALTTLDGKTTVAVDA